MDKDKILDYVMNSPQNTNPNVLKSMLETLISENSGYKIEKAKLPDLNNQGHTIADLTKIGPLVICEFSGASFNENIEFNFNGKESFTPDTKNTKARNYNSLNLYLKLGSSTLGFSFEYKYQGQGNYHLSIKGDSSKYVGQPITGITIYFAETEEPII